MEKITGTAELDVPDGATVGRYPITEVGYNHGLNQVYVIFEGEELLEGWDQFIFPAQNNGENIIIEEIPPSLVSPTKAAEGDSPGANEAEEVYCVLRENNIDISEI